VIVVDTSVWVAAMRHPRSEDAEVLRSLLDADEVALALPVRLELMAGVSRRDRAAFRRGLSALPVVRPTAETWALIESWIEPAADAGERFAATDLLIAGLARELGALVWSLDGDFARMEKLDLVRLYREM
jgi:predicted nucleic acid-binding protein